MNWLVFTVAGAAAAVPLIASAIRAQRSVPAIVRAELLAFARDDSCARVRLRYMSDPIDREKKGTTQYIGEIFVHDRTKIDELDALITDPSSFTRASIMLPPVKIAGQRTIFAVGKEKVPD